MNGYVTYLFLIFNEYLSSISFLSFIFYTLFFFYYMVDSQGRFLKSSMKEMSFFLIKESLSLYDKILLIDSNNLLAYYNKGNSLRELGRL